MRVFLSAIFCCLVVATMSLDQHTVSEIKNLTAITRRILDYTSTAGAGASYNDCAFFCDKFGPRQTLSQAVEDSIDYGVALMRKEGFDKVHTQTMQQTRWVRGVESIELIEPRRTPLLMLGLGGSVPASGIVAKVVIVKNFLELERRQNDVKGNIVLFNYPFTSYGDVVQYRINGASAAAQYGAVAALVRSITPLSLATPHTGTLRYRAGLPRIPSAAITTEDTDMLQRMQDRNVTIVIKLDMGCTTQTGSGRNAVGEITGSTFPNEVIVVGGHIDSWDVGQGAMDNADGAFVTFESIRILKKLNLRPKRTIRVVWWNDEEFGGTGGRQYVLDQDAHISDHILAFESDGGTFLPYGFGFTGSKRAKDILAEIAKQHLAPIGVTQMADGGGGADTAPLMARGVPGMNIRTRNEKYFWYHHTHADMMNVLSPKDMDLCSASISAMMYVVADMNERLPRN
jgi:carboxypeptidase Q